jgi:hypothetical protein
MGAQDNSNCGDNRCVTSLQAPAIFAAKLSRRRLATLNATQGVGARSMPGAYSPSANRKPPSQRQGLRRAKVSSISRILIGLAAYHSLYDLFRLHLIEQPWRFFIGFTICFFMFRTLTPKDTER